MKITAHHHVNEILQRSYVEFQGRRYVRLARSFDPVTGELQPDPGPPAPAQVWKVEHGVGFETLGPNRSDTLEKAFIAELIAQNSKPKLSATFGAAVKVEPPTTPTDPVSRHGKAACLRAYELKMGDYSSYRIHCILKEEGFCIVRSAREILRMVNAGRELFRSPNQ